MSAMLRQHEPSAGFATGVRWEGNGLSRFAHVTKRVKRGDVGLRADHPALVVGRTIYPSTVVAPHESPRLLVSGINASKIGKAITRGAWRGLPIYTLTLEERATCPRACALWRECYGNAMHLARRHRHGRDLELALGDELAALACRHPRGFAVRLHVLGDFYSARYAARWAVWLRRIPQLHVFGFTAWADGSPIAQLIERMNGAFADRCAIRFSRSAPSGQGWEAITIWREPEGHRVAEGLMCPQQAGRTATYGSCGLCWSQALGQTPIVFVGHGKGKRGA